MLVETEETQSRMTGDEMRDLRQRLGWGQERLAHELELSLSRIGAYERGFTVGKTTRRAPIPKVVELACQMLLIRYASRRGVE